MGGAKPWQIAVVVLGILSLLWVLIYQLGSTSTAPETRQDFVLVDIDTGELFKVHRPDDRSLPIPAVRPGTQKLNLLPVEKTDNGWAVPEQFRNLLTKDMPAVGDLATGVMKTTGEPEFLDLFGG
jgi:hypothetical protein